MNPIPATPEPFNPKATGAYYDNWGLRVFLCSTLFIVIFSVTAIHSWPPLVKHFSILLACILPVAIIVLVRIPIWFREKKPPKEVLWVLLVFILGIAVSLQSENSWITIKSTVLFMASGPFIFIATKYLFESTKSQEVFLWVTSLILLCFGCFGFYEYNYYLGNISLFADNPLPAGASLIILSTSPMILLTRNCSAPLRLSLILSLISSAILIILLAKKGPILSLVVILLFLVGFITRKHLKLLLGFALLTGCLLLTSESTLSKYKSTYKVNSSITMRAEHYFFGFHIFQKKVSHFFIYSKEKKKPCLVFGSFTRSTSKICMDTAVSTVCKELDTYVTYQDPGIKSFGLHA